MAEVIEVTEAVPKPERAVPYKEGAPLVSIVVSVYNHSKYIEECLRGILMQKVNFDYEVWVGDDNSPDLTRDVLKKLAPEFPDNFHFVCRLQNLGAVGNGEDLYNRSTGKYMVDMEGDDFWLFDGKLQAQVDYLEQHPECSVTYTHCIVVGEDSKPNGEVYPQCPYETYTFNEFFYSRLPGQSCTLVCRREQYLNARDDFMDNKRYPGYYPGDRRNAFLYLVAGEVHVFQDEWTAYRHVIKKGGTSFASTVAFDDKYAINEVGYGQTLKEYAEKHGTPEAIKAAKMTYYRVFHKWALDKRSSIKMEDFKAALSQEKSGKLGFYLAHARYCVVLGLRKYVLRQSVDL